jgi:uncharacterized membrane protein YeaQ/YmgE (transglycosylase-associated protein family)
MRLEAPRRMNPIFDVLLWIGIGAAVGWLITKATGTSRNMGTAADLGVGIFGAVGSGAIALVMFHGSMAGAPRSYGSIAGLFASLGGACVLLAVSKLAAKAI